MLYIVHLYDIDHDTKHIVWNTVRKIFFLTSIENNMNNFNTAKTYWKVS